MRFHRSIFRAAAVCVIACALLGATFSGPASATSRVAAARAQGLYYASFGHAGSTVAAARAQGVYYASFGHETPLTPRQSPWSARPWVLPGTGLVIALLVVAGVTVETRRLAVRRHAARGTTSV